MRGLLRSAALCALVALTSASADAEAIKIGLGTGGVGSLFVTEDKGYFAAEGLTVEFVFFPAAEPVAVGVASGAIDFGASGLSAALYNFAGQGHMRVIAGTIHEAPGFQFLTFVRAKQASGIDGFKGLAGHSVAVPQIGSPSHYSLALIAEKYGFDLASVRVLPLQSVANCVSAASGGQADATVIPAGAVMPAIAHGDVKLMGYVGNETPWQIQAIFISTKTADERRDTVERFLRAYRKGARQYYDAFADGSGKRRDGPDAAAFEALIAKYNHQSIDQVKLGIAYVDPEARIDVKDVRHQIAWYRQQNMLKTDVDADIVIDRRYATALP